MRHIVSFFIYLFLAFFYCFGQNNVLSFKHKLFPQKLNTQSIKWQTHRPNTKSYLFKPSLECPVAKTELHFNLSKNALNHHKHSYKRVHLFVRGGQRLSKALSFSSKAFLSQVPQKLAFTGNLPLTEEDKISFFKTALETIKTPETRVGVFSNIIIQNDTRRISNVISSNADARLRPYSAINARTNLLLLGINILI